jgi:hypothetical protein
LRCLQGWTALFLTRVSFPEQQDQAIELAL